MDLVQYITQMKALGTPVATAAVVLLCLFLVVIIFKMLGGMRRGTWKQILRTATVIGTLMLLVPGILFTNALRDIIFGDTNSGINRVVEALLIAAAVALGTAVAWNLTYTNLGLPAFPERLYHSDLSTGAVCIPALCGTVYGRAVPVFWQSTDP